jgi:hypothetical protein
VDCQIACLLNDNVLQVLINALLEGSETPTSDTISKDEPSSPMQGGEDLILTSTITVTAPSNVETAIGASTSVTSSSTAEVTIVTSEEHISGATTIVNSMVSAAIPAAGTATNGGEQHQQSASAINSNVINNNNPVPPPSTGVVESNSVVGQVRRSLALEWQLLIFILV